MTRLFLTLVLLLPLTAFAQDSTAAMKPIRFSSRWDVHKRPVRLRPAADSTAAWRFGTALRFDGQSFRVVDEQSRLLTVDPWSDWIVEARVWEPEIRGSRAGRGALIGAVIGSAAVIVDAVTCTSPRGEGPGCGIVLVLLPVAAGGGVALGGIIGSLLPVHPWQRVRVEHP
jgi:hypothetical protein